MALSTLQRPTDHPLARVLWPHLLADAYEELRLPVSVALLAQAGVDQAEIAQRTGGRRGRATACVAAA